ncbi:MAG: hypothetical protein IRZ02_01760 [Acidothermus sp.]|nr:hypothetical protein [Acidothermus sp.]MCL6537739.1 hypothetical protein [Acidothermus sp.]
MTAKPPRQIVTGRPRRREAGRAYPAIEDLYTANSYGQTLLRSLMRAQLGLSLSVLAPAAAVVALYPLLVVLVPSLAHATVGFLPVSLVVLGGGIYPPLVALAFWYVRRARRIEERFIELLLKEKEDGG